MKNRRIQFRTAGLAVVLATTLALFGCGSLTRIVSQPAPPREEAEPAVAENLLRPAEENYAGIIEPLHGSWEEPCYSPDELGYFYEYRGWIYLHLEGEGAERGYQHGWLLADYIQREIDLTIRMLAKIQGIDWRFFREHAERMWADKVSEELKAELEGIVLGAGKRGATFDYVDLLVLNGLEELCDDWFPTVRTLYHEELAAGLWSPRGNYTTQLMQEGTPTGEREATTGEEAALAGEEADAANEGAVPVRDGQDAPEDTSTGEDATALSNEQGTSPEEEAAVATTKQASIVLATGSATEDGTIILAHNTIASYASASFFNIMLDIVPKEGQRMTLQAAPGYIYSTGEAYTTDSLVVASARINEHNAYSTEGTPEFLRAREAVQYAKTLDEFTEAMLKGNNGGLASSWLVGELKTNEIMELELGLSFYDVQKLTDGFFINFNGVDSSSIRNFETGQSNTPDIRESAGARFVRLSELCAMHNGTLTEASAQELIADHYDAYVKGSGPSARSVCAHYDLDDARHALGSGASAAAYLPYGTVDAKVLSTNLAKEHKILARWGSACGRAFDSTAFKAAHPQYALLSEYLFDRPSEFWSELYALS